jgi:hypothetical protein
MFGNYFGQEFGGTLDVWVFVPPQPLPPHSGYNPKVRVVLSTIPGIKVMLSETPEVKNLLQPIPQVKTIPNDAPGIKTLLNLQ